MNEITLEELIDYSEYLEHEEVDFYDGLLHSYDQNHLFESMYIEDDIEWMKEKGGNYVALEVLHKYMENKEITECYIVE